MQEELNKKLTLLEINSKIRVIFIIPCLLYGIGISTAVASVLLSHEVPLYFLMVGIGLGLISWFFSYDDYYLNEEFKFSKLNSLVKNINNFIVFTLSGLGIIVIANLVLKQKAELNSYDMLFGLILGLFVFYLEIKVLKRLEKN